MKPISMFDPNSERVDRGGSWSFIPSFARVADRLGGTPVDRGYYLGFRLARSVR